MGSTPLPSHSKDCKNGINSFPARLSNRSDVEEEWCRGGMMWKRNGVEEKWCGGGMMWRNDVEEE